MNYIRKILIFSSHCQSGRKKKDIYLPVERLISQVPSIRETNTRCDRMKRSVWFIQIKTNKKGISFWTIRPFFGVPATCNWQQWMRAQTHSRRVSKQKVIWDKRERDEAMIAYSPIPSINSNYIRITETRTFNRKKKEKRIVERQNVTIEKRYREIILLVSTHHDTNFFVVRVIRV